MFRGYQLAIIALGLMLLAYQAHSHEVGWVPENDPETQSGENEGAADSDAESAPKQYDTLSLGSTIKGIEAAIRDLVAVQNQEKDADEIQRDKDDLNAQEDMAFWAMLMFISALCSVLLTGAGLYLIWKNLQATREAVDAANRTVYETKKIGEAQVRAYLSVTGQGIGAGTSEDNPSPKLMIKNWGNTPAKHVRGSAAALIVPLPVRTIDLEPFIKRLKIPPYGFVLNPGESIYSYASLEGVATEENKRNVVEKRSCLLVFGRFKFSDCFDVGHEVDFCHYYSGPELSKESMELYAPGNRST